MTENTWRPWCPLFVKNPVLINAQTKIPRRIQQCLDVHREVRRIWEVAQFDLSGSRFPGPDDLPDYPMCKVESARVLWEVFYLDFDVLFLQKTTSASEFEMELKNIIYRVRIRASVDERITDCEIIALLAMSAAWNALFNMVYQKLPVDHQSVVVMTKTAYALLPLVKKVREETSKNIQLQPTHPLSVSENLNFLDDMNLIWIGNKNIKLSKKQAGLVRAMIELGGNQGRCELKSILVRYFRMEIRCVIPSRQRQPFYNLENKINNKYKRIMGENLIKSTGDMEFAFSIRINLAEEYSLKLAKTPQKTFTSSKDTSRNSSKYKA